MPLDVFVGGHVRASQTIHEIAAHYRDNARVRIIAIDNSRGMGGQGEVPLSLLRGMTRYTESGLASKLWQVLEDAYHGRNGQSKISERVYRGTRPAP